MTVVDFHNYATRRDTFAATSMDALVRDLCERALLFERGIATEQDAHDLAAGFLTLDESLSRPLHPGEDPDVPSESWPCTQQPEPTAWLTPWIDLGPAQDAGDIGGDEQQGTAWSRRFVRQKAVMITKGRKKGQRKRDRNDEEVQEWAVVDVAVFLASNDQVPEPWFAAQAHFTLCTDYRDPGSTETWSDIRTGQFDTIRADEAPMMAGHVGEQVVDTEKANDRAKVLAGEVFTVEEFELLDWSGEQFSGPHSAPPLGLGRISW